MPLIATTAQHIGQRDKQEDTLLWDPSLCLAIVADGLDGHARGEVASALAVQAVQQVLCSLPRKLRPEAALAHAMAVADEAVRTLDMCRVTKTKQHKMSCHCRSPATTLTALWFTRGEPWLAHAGDSRCYVLPEDGPLQQVSTDHVSPWGGLSQCLGGGACRPQILPLPVRGRWLLCSDGLVDALTGEEIADLLRGAPAEGAAGVLVGAVVAKGRERQDNVSVVVIDGRPEPG